MNLKKNRTSKGYRECCTFYAFRIEYDRERIFVCSSFTLVIWCACMAVFDCVSFTIFGLLNIIISARLSFSLSLFVFDPSLGCCCIVIVVDLNMFAMFFFLHHTLVGPCWCSFDYNNSVLSHSNTVSHNSSISFCSLIVQTCVTYIDL